MTARFTMSTVVALIALSGAASAEPDSPTTTTQPMPAPAATTPAATTPRDTTHYNLGKQQLAIEGYDPVAYYPEGGGQPTKGKPELSYAYRGVNYRFANQANLDLFKKNPGKYEPAYGGWCASAIAIKNKKVEIDPKAYKITGERLFLFYKDIFTDARGDWNADEPGNITKGDDNWKKTTGEEARKPDQAVGDKRQSTSTPATPDAQPSRK